MLEKINFNDLDKSKLESFRFDEIAKRVAEGVDPNTTTLEKYVGLEHIDAENIHIKRFGSPDDVSGGKLKCYSGDVIFGKRRAYQRKAAIVDFEGICSAHAFVFRANQEVIDPRLFPFFLHSDQFMHRAVDISVGGLSPTINWGDLKYQEFLIPPKEDQARLLELLWAMDEVIESEKKLIITLKKYMRSYFISNYKKWKSNNRVRLGDVTNAKQWKTISKNELTEDGYLVYGGNGIIGKYTEYNHEKSTIAIACRGEYCGNVHYTLPKSYVTGNSMCLDNLDELKFKSKFLFYYLKYTDLTPVISGSAQPQIIKQDLENYKINEISLKTQDEVILKMDLIYNSIEKINAKICASLSLQKSIINHFF